MVNQAILSVVGDLGYGRNTVLRDLDIELFPGDFTGLAGLNGSGKSTLLRNLGGLLDPLKGKVLLNGKNIAALSARDRARKISLVLTHRYSGFNLNVLDVVASGRMPYSGFFNRMGDEDKRMIGDAIQQCGLKGYEQSPLSTLSDGLFQKTMIARALAQQTAVILLDEPAAFLDYASKHELFILLKKLAAEQNKCILFSTHELDLLIRYCDNVLLLHDKKAESIKVSESHDHPQFQKLSGGFLG
jgi:iron complex transport system ATP-binding protein